tara:strand:+ start:290 stop:514 length:225 start_codon:yes stop_codon:yes gene_type:complete
MFNSYSIAHFIQYFILGRYIINSWKIFFLISIGWELLEIILPFEFARESILNKFSDIGVNCLGFYIGKLTKKNR